MRVENSCVSIVLLTVLDKLGERLRESLKVNQKLLVVLEEVVVLFSARHLVEEKRVALLRQLDVEAGARRLRREVDAHAQQLCEFFPLVGPHSEGHLLVVDNFLVLELGRLWLLLMLRRAGTLAQTLGGQSRGGRVRWLHFLFLEKTGYLSILLRAVKRG